MIVASSCGRRELYANNAGRENVKRESPPHEERAETHAPRADQERSDLREPP